jgi:elongator complex protein 4
MSSFKRRVTTTPIPGTRPSPYNSLPLLSTGLSSLDDLLGGGLPLSSSLLVQSDSPTSYADLLLKFWIAQGLECKQDVVVVASGLEGGPQGIAESLMEVDGGQVAGDEDEEEEGVKGKEEKLKIAFRYEGMKQHAVTVAAPARELSRVWTDRRAAS